MSTEPPVRRAWVAAGYASFDDYLRAELGELVNKLPAADRLRNPAAESLRSQSGIPQSNSAEDDLDGRLIDLRDVPSRWPTREGMVSPAPHAWRYEFAADHLAAVDAFYRDLLWNVQLELDGVDWPGRSRRDGASVVAACRDVARLWSLPSAETTLPAASGRGRIRVPAGCDSGSRSGSGILATGGRREGPVLPAHLR